MRELLKALLILGGGGLAVWYFMRGQTAAQPTAAQPEQPAAPAPSTATKDLIRTASTKAGYAADGRLNYDQWNYFYRQVRGVDGPDPETVFPGQDRTFLLTLDEYWAGASQHGLSGIRPWRDPAFEAWGIKC
jgi:hypothetical protein